MNKKIALLIAILIGCGANCFAQGKVSRTAKQTTTTKQTKKQPQKQTQKARPLTGVINGHEWVDLGLSVKWATCNVGATKPEEYGDYFAWGETTTKSSYDKDNSITYNQPVSALQSKGRINSKGTLTRNYDAASVNWGGSWRMPTKEEDYELLEKCKWEWISQGGTKGYNVTGPNGNSIFLPATGYCSGSLLNYDGEYGYHWSSSVYDGRVYAYNILFTNGFHSAARNDRFIGFSVRPVVE